MPPCFRSFHSWTLRMSCITGWWNISPGIHIVRSMVARLPQSARSLPALYRARRLALCHTSSTLQIWGRRPSELLKYADDTYVTNVIIIAANVYSQCSELEHIQRWAETNNLTLNCNKPKEIIVTLSHRSKRVFNPPSWAVSEWRHLKYLASISQTGASIHIGQGGHVPQ